MTRHVSLVVLIVAACGSVSSSEIDAGGTGDAADCVGDTVEECGASCETCTSSEREVATCDGTSCGTECVELVPTCRDGSCSRLTWDFASGELDGITPQAPAGLTLRVGSRAGSDALAVDVTTLTEVLFSVPICNTAAIDFSDRRLSYDVFFEGGNPQGEQYFVQTSVPSNDLANAQLGLQNIQAGVNVVVTGLFSDSMFSDQANQFTVQAGTFGAAFSGTIWFDNFRIE